MRFFGFRVILSIVEVLTRSGKTTRHSRSGISETEKFDSAYGSAQNDSVGAKSKPVGQTRMRLDLVGQNREA